MNVKYFRAELGSHLKNNIEFYIKKKVITKDQIVSLNIWSDGSLHYGILIHE